MQRIYSMNYKIKTIPRFEKELKRMAKKYPSLKNEYIKLVNELRIQPKKGTSIGNSCYKIRLAIISKGRGKSGGTRVITYLHIVDTTVFLLSIYDKSEQENIPDKELAELLKWIP